jgi:hypothetical protein
MGSQTSRPVGRCRACPLDHPTARTQRRLLGLTDEQRNGIILTRARQLADTLPAQGQPLPTVRDLRDLLALPAKTEG